MRQQNGTVAINQALIVFNYLYSLSSAFSIKQIVTNNDINRVTGILIQQQIQVVLSSTINKHFFLPIRPVYTSSGVGTGVEITAVAVDVLTLRE